jgi:hypothetical protein
LVFIEEIYRYCDTMDNLNLGSDESILKKNPKIIVSGSRYEAVLTNRRLILTDRETGEIREAVPYPDITLAVAGLNSIREPVLRLVINPDSGEQRSMEMIFVYQPGGLNLQDLEASIAILKDRKVTVQGSAHLDATSLMSRINAVSSSIQSSDEPEVRPAVPDMTIMGTSRYSRQPAPEDSPKKPYLIAIAVVVVIIAVIFAGLFIAGLVSKEPSPVTPKNHSLPNPTGTSPLTPLPSTSMVGQVPVSAGFSAQVPVPANGTWVRISYPGNYSGSVKAGGWNTEVNSTGTTDYLLPVRDSVIEGTIEKLDGSGERLVVGIYYYGNLISESDTTKPYGVVDLNLDIQQALAATPVPTRVPTPVLTSQTDISVPEVTAPASGVWARVFYPGYYAGYFSANGRMKEINSTGDQFFQLAMSSGSIDGLIEKQDDSGRHMIVQVYKDGVLVTTLNTTAPHGDIDLHTTI